MVDLGNYCVTSTSTMPGNLVLVGKCSGCLSRCSKKLHVLLVCKLKLLYYYFSFKWKPFTLWGIWIFNLGNISAGIASLSDALCIRMRGCMWPFSKRWSWCGCERFPSSASSGAPWQVCFQQGSPDCTCPGSSGLGLLPHAFQSSCSHSANAAAAFSESKLQA